MVLYFTGTGNSRYLALRIAEELDIPLYDLNTCIKAGVTAYLRMAYSPGGVPVAGQHRADRGRAHLVCDGLRQRDRQCGEI